MKKHNNKNKKNKVEQELEKEKRERRNRERVASKGILYVFILRAGNSLTFFLTHNHS